ncbi:MAG TPA: iron-containing alcohol dehydrogenase, partial [Bacilli bacterium]|nr:iron-containing alcohol dehydrogenase [Bacilli bacterium]
FHIKAIHMINENLVKAVNKDPEAMDKMGVAQYIAGMGFSNVGLGIVHSMAHQLGATYDVPHGIACSLFLPYVLAWNGEYSPERFRIIASDGFDIDTTNLSDSECVDAVVSHVRELEDTLKVPQHLSQVGAKKEDFNILAEKAINDPCTGGNPRPVTKEDIISLFNQAF